MGHMIDGVWHDVPRDTKATAGRFVRPDSPILVAFDQKVDPSQIFRFLRVIGPFSFFYKCFAHRLNTVKAASR